MNNMVGISGNVGDKPEPKSYTTKDGRSGLVARFPIGVYMSKERTMWVYIVCYDKLADEYHSNIEKGYKVDVLGRLDFSKYTGKDGKSNYSHHLIADSIRYRPPREKTISQ